MTHLILLLVFGADVQALDADNFAVRQAASARLERHAWLTWRLCKRACTKSTSAEKRWRARRVVDAHLHLADVRPLSDVLSEQYWWAIHSKGADNGETRAGRGSVPNTVSQAHGWEVRTSVPWQRHHPLTWLAEHYAKRAGAWYDYNQFYGLLYLFIADQRDSTRLLARDLLRLSIPRPIVRYWLDNPN